jgi:hypothetical protein
VIALAVVVSVHLLAMWRLFRQMPDDPNIADLTDAEMVMVEEERIRELTPVKPRCGCPNPLTDTIHGVCDEGNWWHQEPCPVVAWRRELIGVGSVVVESAEKKAKR